MDNKSATTPRTAMYYKSLPLANSTPINKEENIRNYLASLPYSSEPRLHQLEEDQGIGENMLCMSESGSDYSSPILTPPEEEQIHALYRLAKEVQENKESVLNQPTEDHSTVNSATEVSPPITSEVPSKPESSEAVKFKVPHPPLSSITTTATSSTRDQPVAGNDYMFIQVPSKVLRASSLPHNLAYSTYPNRISPNSSKTMLSSLANPSAAAGPQQDLTDSRTGSRAESRSPVPWEACLPVVTENEVIGNDTELFESTSDSPLELREPAGQHRRAKSDTCNLSGPVKTAQIQSVPERVKEIEELHAQATKPQAQSTTLEREKEKPVDFYIGSSTSPSPSPRPVDKRSSMSSSVSRSSSEESLSLRQSLEASNDEDYQVQCSPNKLYRSPRVVTRHSSLSPKPSVGGTHLRLQSSMSLPPEINPLFSGQEARSEEDIASSLQGVVRAKVQNIEERNKESGLDSRKVSVASLEGSVKRSSPPAQRKPGDAVEQRSSSIAESLSSKATEGTFSYEGSEPSQVLSECSPPPPPPPPPPQVIRRRPSSDTIIERPSSVMESSSMCLSLQPVSTRSMSVQNIPSQVASVRQLKRKFEDSEGSENSRPLRNFRVNLRRSRSLRDMESPYRQHTNRGNPRKMVSTSRIGGSQVASAQSSPPRSKYITTIPTETVHKDVDDFQTTLNKFSMMTSTAAQ